MTGDLAIMIGVSDRPQIGEARVEAMQIGRTDADRDRCRSPSWADADRRRCRARQAGLM